MSTTTQTCLGHGCDHPVPAKPWKPEFCSGACFHRTQCCGCLRCADLRVEKGWRPMFIRIGRSVFPSLPVEVAS